jgi:hypothetical protein
MPVDFLSDASWEAWVGDPEKMLGLGIIIFSYDTQRYVSNDKAYDEHSCNKDWYET